MLTYFVEAPDPASHLFNIKMVIESPDPNGQKLSLPNWIPGSYLIRDYARHIISLKANVAVEKINSNTWLCEKTADPLTLEYQVYAWDRSVRGAHLDREHGFFNGCCLFLMVHGQEQKRSRVHIGSPKGGENWQVATTLPRETAPARGFGWYCADSYDELIDHPVEMAALSFYSFQAKNTPHTIAIYGKHNPDLSILLTDLSKICETQIQIFDDNPPFKEYLFLVNVSKDGYGGLEHRSSSALMVARDSLSLPHLKEKKPEYINTLGLFSHEYFHAWLVKRIKPASFLPYKLNEKAYTRQLWIFEGITSYYDDLALVRSKVITQQQYLDLLAKKITKLMRNPGRKQQTLAESSFDAWIKFYQPNENSNNVLVSYYLKGSIVAWALDLALRQQSSSLDVLVKQLWDDYGKKGVGLPEGAFETLCSDHPFIHQALYTTEDINLMPLLEPFGLELLLRQANNKDEPTALNTRLGCSLLKKNDRIQIQQVMLDSPAHHAGLCANDEIVCVDGFKIDSENFANKLQAGQTISIHFFRLDELRSTQLTLAEAPFDTAELIIKDATNLGIWLNSL